MSETKKTKVVVGRVGLVRKAVERLNRRAVKLGLPELVLTVSDAVENVRVTVEGGAEVIVATREVTIEGDGPVLPGYKLAGIATRIAGDEGENVPAKNILKTVGKIELPASFHDRQQCDHCKVKRLRNTYFIVRHEETGAFVQVGSTCVQEFLGSALFPAAALNLYAAAMAVLGFEDDATDEAFATGRHGEQSYDLTEFLTVTAAVVRARGGFLSKSRAWSDGGCPTVDFVRGYFHAVAESDLRNLPIEQRDRDVAAAIEASVEKLTADDGEKSEYVGNLTAACSLGYVTDRTAGLVASAYAVWARAVADEASAKLAATSKPIGDVGRRLNLVGLTVTQVKAIDGYYGTSWLVKMLTKDGSVAATFASRDPDLNVDDVTDVRATVREHRFFRGVAETNLTRAVFSKRATEVLA